MKRIAIYCVTYNSYPEFYHYLDSICQAVKTAEGKAEVEVFVADNTDKVPQEISYQTDNVRLKVFPFHQNLGYFGAIGKMMQQVDTTVYDYCIISNVDLILDKDMLIMLAEYPYEDTTGWIAPQIWSQQEKRDRNPKIISRYPLSKLKKLQTLFKYPLLYALYIMTLYRRKTFQNHSAGEIYAGHGSFIILTREYLTRCGIIDYPVFLFCEEIYLGEQCRLHDLKVVYQPDIHVVDTEHASTCTFKRSKYCKYNYQAISHILKNYYT